MPWAATSAWAVDVNYNGHRGCTHAREGGHWNPTEWKKHGQGDFPTSVWKGKGRGTWARCTSGGGNGVAYRPGKRGHPCTGAAEIQGYPINIWFQDKTGYRARFNSQAAFWCRFPDTSSAMIEASKRVENNEGRVGNNGPTVYKQLLFGTNPTPHLRGTGFCENVANLSKQVHKDGSTCFEMIKKESGDVVANLQGIKFCRQYPRDPRCKCMNVAGQGFMETCRKNPSWAGCSDINKALAELKKAGVSSATGLFGNADCLVPQICSGSDMYMPQNRPQACANKLAICNQVLKLDNIQAAAGVKAAQACNINFEAEQKKKDAAKAAAAAKVAAAKAAAAKAAAAKAAAAKAAAAARRTPTSSPAAARGTPASSPAAAGGTPARSPVLAGSLVSAITKKTGVNSQMLGIGAVGILLSCCCLVVILLLLSGGGSKSRR